MEVVAPRHQPGHMALRRGRRSIAGQTSLITTTTAGRNPWLARWAVGAAVAREMGANRLWRESQVHAWVLMSDHMHVLLTLSDSESLSHLMARVKAVSARAARRVTGASQPFFARAFHDHALRHDGAVTRAARYVIANPVRAGLVDSIWSWPFWDSEWLPEAGADGLDVAGDASRGFRRSCG